MTIFDKNNKIIQWIYSNIVSTKCDNRIEMFLKKLYLAITMGTEKVISLCAPSNSKKSGLRSHQSIFTQSDLECSPCYSPIHANEELTGCDGLIKEECLKNISVYEVIDKIDNELTNIYYENS